MSVETAQDPARVVRSGRHAHLRRYGPWALVTGASSGIGRAIALQLADAGLDLVLVARGGDALEAVAGEARSRGVEARTLSADLGTEAGLRAVDQTTAELDIGLLVAAAGFGTSGRFIDSALDDELAMLDLNVGAVLAQARTFAERFRARSGGGMILFGSLLGWNGTPNAASYAATKAWVQVFAEGIGAELAPHGIDVLAAAPGPVATGFGDRAEMRMGWTDRADKVAASILSALGRRRAVVPGALSKFLTYSLAFLPRAARIRVLGTVIGGMTSHQHG